MQLQLRGTELSVPRAAGGLPFPKMPDPHFLSRRHALQKLGKRHRRRGSGEGYSFRRSVARTVCCTHDRNCITCLLQIPQVNEFVGSSQDTGNCHHLGKYSKAPLKRFCRPLPHSPPQC
jgi:hypothetical protein